MLTRERGNFEEILAEADLLVELMGGIEPAKQYLLAAIRAGKDVVSANKQLLSQHGEELFETAREYGVRLRFEAAVAGVVPVVRVLEESLAATPIERVHGIVNGTTNFILTEMGHGSSYAEALAEAQRRGFAEADPSDDVSGRDAAATQPNHFVYFPGNYRWSAGMLGALSSGMMAVIELTTPTTDPSPVTTGPPELPGWTGTVI